MSEGLGGVQFIQKSEAIQQEQEERARKPQRLYTFVDICSIGV